MTMNPYQPPGYGSSEGTNRPIGNDADDKHRRQDLALEGKFISMGLGFLILGGTMVANKLWFSYHYKDWLHPWQDLFVWAVAIWLPGGFMVMRFQRLGLFVIFSTCVYAGWEGIQLASYRLENLKDPMIPQNFPNFEIDMNELMWPSILLRVIFVMFLPSTYRVLSRAHRELMMRTRYLDSERPWRIDYFVWAWVLWCFVVKMYWSFRNGSV